MIYNIFLKKAKHMGSVTNSRRFGQWTRGSSWIVFKKIKLEMVRTSIMKPVYISQMDGDDLNFYL